MDTNTATTLDTNESEQRSYTQAELDSEIEFALAEQLRNLPLVVFDNLTDADKTRVLDVAQFDKMKTDEACEHLFALGLSARENSIRATRKRQDAERLLTATAKLQDYLRVHPEDASEPAKLIAAMRAFGLAPLAQTSSATTK